MEHEFTARILAILERTFGGAASEILERNLLLQYINLKTRSAGRGSKSRASFASLYAIYVVVEDYVKGGFDRRDDYSGYEGARFSQLFTRQRELPFGSKLQNHALNSRLNEEFRKYFPAQPHVPILRDVTTNRYWFNERLLVLTLGPHAINLARVVLEVIEAYVEAKQESFARFISDCERIASIQQTSPNDASDFVTNLLRPTVDARIFEIVSYAILRAYYAEQVIYWGWTPDQLETEALILYKTGRTNANDGGIDFVMRPLGRFFQVTETIDVKKYFLDIDKVQRYPITFVVKSEDSVEAILDHLRRQARSLYAVDAIVQRYFESVEEIVNIPRLSAILADVIASGRLVIVTDEIVVQSRVEFNMDQE